MVVQTLTAANQYVTGVVPASLESLKVMSIFSSSRRMVA